MHTHTHKKIKQKPERRQEREIEKENTNQIRIPHDLLKSNQFSFYLKFNFGKTHVPTSNSVVEAIGIKAHTLLLYLIMNFQCTKMSRM